MHFSVKAVNPCVRAISVIQSSVKGCQLSALLLASKRTRFMSAIAALAACAVLATLGVAQAEATTCSSQTMSAHSLCVSEAWISGGKVFLIASSSPELGLCVGLTTWNGSNWADSSPVACGLEPFEELNGYSGHPYVYNNSSSTIGASLSVW